MNSRRRILPAAFAALIASVAFAVPASAGTVEYNTSLGYVQVSGDAGVNTITVSGTSANTITVTDTTTDPTVVSGSEATCSASGDTVTCTPVSLSAVVFGGDEDDVLTVAGAFPVAATLSGDGGEDQLQGGAGDDKLYGGASDDFLDGGAGVDILEDSAFQAAGADTLDGEGDADMLHIFNAGDVARDTGTSGSDVMNLFYISSGATVRVNNGLADDGATGTGGATVLEGFEQIWGGTAADHIFGSAANELLFGGHGGDELEGGLGVDTFMADDGDDTLTLTDGVADGTTECGEGSDVVNADADGDTTADDCETVDRGGGPGPGPEPGPEPGPGGGPPAFPLPLAGVALTTRTSTMPAVVGKEVNKARAAIDAAIPNVNVTLVFTRKCTAKQALEIIKQNPAAGGAVTTAESQVAQVSVDVCTPGKDFLRDCDRRDLDKDLKQLPKKGDAGTGTELLLRLTKCKTDVDVKLSGAGKDPKVGFDDLKRKGGKAAIEATMRCGRTKHDFAVALGEGLQSGTSGDASFSLAERGRKWVLPGDSRAFRSIVEIQVQARTGALPLSEVYVDADDVKPSQLTPGQVFRTDAGGHARFSIRPTRPGKIRICVTQRVREEDMPTWAAEIEVVPGPKAGDRWKTINGRHLVITERGNGKLVDPPASKARAAGIQEFFSWLAGLFDGRSKAIAQAASSPGSVSLKAPKTFKTAKAGIAQVTLDGKLSSDVQPPALVDGPCLTRIDAVLAASRCPTLVALGGHAVVGIAADGTPLVAAGGGNIVTRAGLVGQDGSTLVGQDGSTLVGQDGSTLVGQDGSTLVGNDGATLVGQDGSTLVGLDGATLTGPGAPLVAAGAGNLTAAMASNAISVAANQMMAGGAGSLVGLDGGTLVAAGGLN